MPPQTKQAQPAPTTNSTSSSILTRGGANGLPSSNPSGIMGTRSQASTTTAGKMSSSNAAK